jgi:hypothetical protein
LQGRPDAEGALAYAAMELTVLELLPSQPLTHFRFRAQVRHLAGNNRVKGGRVGLYALRGERATARGPEHLWCDLSINDFDDADRRNSVLKVRRFRAHPQLNYTSGPLPAALPGARPAAGPGEWYDLALVVTPARVRAFVNGRLAFEQTRKELDHCARGVHHPGPVPAGLNPPLPAQGGLGLLVAFGVGAFRQVALEPLPPAAGP